MKKGIVVASIELTPIETNFYDNSTALVNDEVRLTKERQFQEKRKYLINPINGFSTPKVIVCAGQIENDSIEDKHNPKIKPNQVGIVAPRYENMIEDLSQKDQAIFFIKL